MPHWRIGLHALDRTGPPMLARAFVRWLASTHPDHSVEFVAFRGGPLLEELGAHGPVHVLLDDSEPWDHRRPDDDRVRVVRARASALAPADALLLVSVAAGQSLPYLPSPLPPVVTWVVELGDDLHWLDSPIDLVGTTTTWLAGTAGTAREVSDRTGGRASPDVAPEFIERPDRTGRAEVSRRRAELGVQPTELLVVGAGIGTWRKAPDLFVEVVLAARRRHRVPVRAVWIGGEQDDLRPLVVEQAALLGADADVTFMDNTSEIDQWLACADVFLHTARLDAFPLICLHAAAAGTPVLAFDGVGGTRDMFGDSFAGAPYPDVDSLAGLLVELGEPTRREALAAAQRSRVEDAFVADVAAPTVLDRLLLAAGTVNAP